MCNTFINIVQKCLQGNYQQNLGPKISLDMSVNPYLKLQNLAYLVSTGNY